MISKDILWMFYGTDIYLQLWKQIRKKIGNSYLSYKGLFLCSIIKLNPISLLSWQCPNNVLMVYLKSWDSLPPEPHSYNRIKISFVLFRRLCWWKVILPRLHLVFLFSSILLMRHTFQIINEVSILQLPQQQ